MHIANGGDDQSVTRPGWRGQRGQWGQRFGGPGCGAGGLVINQQTLRFNQHKWRCKQ